MDKLKTFFYLFSRFNNSYFHYEDYISENLYRVVFTGIEPCFFKFSLRDFVDASDFSWFSWFVY